MLAGLALLAAAMAVPALARVSPRGSDYALPDCVRPDGALAQGETLRLAADAPASLAMELDEIERIEIDLDGTPVAAADPAAPPVLEICDPAGVPIAGELVPGARGMVTLRFIAPAAGRYVVAVAPASVPRTIALRTVRAAAPEVAPLVLGRTVFARLAPRTVRAWSFEGKAGQWVHIAAASESGLALRLVGPAGTSGIDETAEGRTPLLQRRLSASGTWRVDVQSLGDAADDITLEVRDLPAAPPPPAATALRPGVAARGTLGTATDTALYDIAVRAGHSYEVAASAPFDLALDLGLPDPLEGDDGAPASGISVRRSIDAARSGGETAGFTAASDGHVLLRVRAVGPFEGGAAFTLTLTESGR
ncbi:hypothetical protein AQZ52_05970 [Novosphingobium fuchskuhlense]|uniref:Peptidase C-terminal archaeal/bacterial domain-containing protein n=2 Tax=Novosphingobium fuchskuhlense TaxID=1117702 RepID=A0A124JVY6_9SPHN|nr:hypothetical protein AQZ52_05970 [Novosphingobium fuchskuhlense]